MKHRILRIFRIWEERQIYDEEFLTDLTGLLSVTAGKQASDVDPNDFQVLHCLLTFKMSKYHLKINFILGDAIGE